MQAIILAAGMGKRLKELTQDRTKCMVQVNGVALIDRMLHQIESRHLSRIVIVVGYEGEKLMKYIDTLGIRTPIVYVQNPIYDKTNNIYSLALAKDYLCQDDTLLFESDLIFEDAVIDQLLDDPRETLALVDKYESWMDGTCVKLGPDDSIASFVPSKNFRFEEAHEYYKTVNIYKFGRHFSRTHYVPFLEAYSKALGNNEYYEQVLRVITMLDDPEIRAKRLSGQLWYEIDDIQDLDIASSMFAQDPDLRVSLMQGRYGGYWRYPQLLDFLLSGEPLFPAPAANRRDSGQFHLPADPVSLRHAGERPAGGQELRRPPAEHPGGQRRGRAHQGPDGPAEGGHRLHPPHLRGVPQPLSGPAQRLLHPGGPGLPVHR